VAAGIAASHVFRPVNRAGCIAGELLGEKVVWQRSNDRVRAPIDNSAAIFSVVAGIITAEGIFTRRAQSSPVQGDRDCKT
jgi:hypothetical protein